MALRVEGRYDAIHGPRRRRLGSRKRHSSATGYPSPPHAYFIGSAVFHYLGPSFAVLLFARVDVLGVAWLRIATAGLIFALWRRRWRAFARLDRDGQALIVGLGAVLAVMNVCFYLAISRLPLATVAAIEFIGPIVLAAIGARVPRNFIAVAVAVAGVYLLTHARFVGEPLSIGLAFANAALFALYIILAHRVARHSSVGGIDGLAAAMVVAFVVVSPIGTRWGAPRVHRPDRARCRHRGRRELFGHPVRLRPTCDGSPFPRHVRPARRVAPRHRDGDRGHHAATVPIDHRPRRHRAGDRSASACTAPRLATSRHGVDRIRALGVIRVDGET